MKEMTKDALLAALSYQMEIGAEDALLDETGGWQAERLEISSILASFDNTQRQNHPAQPTKSSGQIVPTSQLGEISAPQTIKKVVNQTSKPAKQGVDLQNITSLDELRQALLAFEGCDIKRTASNLVFSDGNEAARIMVIGEAPGRDEDRMGVPFVGAAGQLLDKMLGAVKLDRTHVYIANVLPWRPPGNRPPTPEEIMMMRPFLDRHITLINPDIILAVGGSSAKTLLQCEDGIMKLRGKIHHYQAGNGHSYQLLPCLHPGYLLRAPQHKKLAFQDLVTLRRLMAS